MKKEDIIQKILDALTKLPKEKTIEVANFATYTMALHQEDLYKKGFEILIQKSASFDFLKEDDDNLYTIDDIKEKYQCL